MAIVETIEVRFQAKLGNLKEQISGVIAKLNALSAVSEKTGVRFNRTMAAGRAAVLSRTAAVEKDISVESKYQSKLKSTARAAKSAGKAIRKTAGGIGLHRLDEVNLLDQKKSSSGGGGGGGSGSAAGIEEAKDAALLFWKVTRAVGGGLKNFGLKLRSSFSGIAENFGGLTEKIANGIFGKGSGLAGILKNRIAEAIDGGFNGAADESGAPESAANKLADKFANGIASKKAAVHSAARDVASAADFSSESAKTAASGAGANLSQGFADGIASKLSSVKISVAKVVSAAIEKIKEKLKIHSPSKVTYAFGSYFGEGFSGGIAASVDAAKQSAAALSSGAASMLSAKVSAAGFYEGEGGISALMYGAVNEALGSTSIVIPLHVDGIKLGEASIRGINRATRAAGRVLLEI